MVVLVWNTNKSDNKSEYYLFTIESILAFLFKKVTQCRQISDIAPHIAWNMNNPRSYLYKHILLHLKHNTSTCMKCDIHMWLL